MEKDLKVLMIGSDRKLFEDGSAVSERLKEYADLVGELHIVVLSLKKNGLKNKKLSQNLWIYPTNSLSRWLYVKDAASLGKRIVLENKFIRGRSLISAQDPFECGLAALKVKRKWRLPLEAQLHTDPFSAHFNGIVNIIRKVIFRKIIKNSDSLRVVNSRVAREMVSRFSLNSEKISVLPIYVDKEKIAASQISFDLHARYGWKFIILMASRLTPEKNISLALKALALVKEQFSGVGLVIAGSGPEEKRLKKLAKKLGLEQMVAFSGWQEDMTSFFKTANVFMQTSYFEGHQLALIEAGLSGLPVITTPAGLASELKNGEEAMVCGYDDPEPFANAILELISNNHKRESLKMGMKRFLETNLISKNEYLAKIKENWAKTSSRIS